MSKRRWSLRGRGRDERGAVLVFTAVAMLGLLWAGATGVDVGFSVYGSRQAQAMADTAALDLARYINFADAQPTNGAVQTYLNGKLAGVKTDNGSSASMTVTPGLWLNNAWSVPVQGCAPTTPPAVNPCNALKVSATQAVPQIFFGGFNVLNGHSSANTNGSSIAAVTPEACFSIGSYLANINTQQSGVLNSVLSPLGTSANLTAVGYQGLANSYITVNNLIAASGGLLTTSNVMTVSLTGAQWLDIWTEAVESQPASVNCGATPQSSNAVTALDSLDFSGSTSAKLCQLVVINGSSCASGTLTTQGLSAGLNVLQILTTEAQLANGTSALDVTSALNITGVTSAKLSLTLIQPPQVAYGPVNTTVQTAQVSADLQLTVLGIGLLDIPLSAASGTATLKTVTCVSDVMTSTKINASTTVATAAITLLGAPVASLTINGASTTGLTYNASVVPPTSSTVAADSNPITIGTHSPTLSYSGLSILSPVFTLLSSTLPGVLGPVLQAAGVSVGGADVADLGTNCDAVSVVQ